MINLDCDIGDKERIYGRGKVGRNVSVSHCNGQRLNSNTGEFEDFSFSVFGVYLEDRATRYARRIFGDKTIIITNVVVETHYYSMTVDTFLALAERTI